MHRNARKREVCCGCVERGEAGTSIAGKQERGERREVRDACGPFGREDGRTKAMGARDGFPAYRQKLHELKGT